MPNRKETELARAISDNNIEKTEQLLNENKVLEPYDLLLIAIWAKKISAEILQLLETYHPFPKEVSMTTLKYNLYIHGNPHISPNEFKGKPDLYLGQSLGFISPIEFFARTADIEAVRWLLNKNVKERPIYCITGIHESHFTGLDLLDIQEFKQRIANKFNEELVIKCHIIELLLNHPNDDLYKEIDKESNSTFANYREMDLLPFFAWAAFNNRADLFENESFVRLVKSYPKAMNEALKIAAVFDSQHFIKKIITTVDHETISGVLSIAAAAHFQGLLEEITEILNHSGIFIKDIAQENISKADSYLGDELLFWAIRSDNVNAVYFFLKNGIDPNTLIDDESYLHIAVRVGNLPIVQILLDHGAKIDSKEYFQKTPLHEACEYEKWDIAELLIKRSANVSELDRDGKTPLDYIKDETIRKRLSALANENVDRNRLLQNQFKLFPQPDDDNSSTKQGMDPKGRTLSKLS